MIDIRALTYEEYRVLRLLAALEAAYPHVRPRDGGPKPSDLVRAYEERRAG